MNAGETDEGTNCSGESCDLEEPIRQCESKECLTYWAVFGNAAKLADEEGDEVKSGKYRMLSVLCSFETQFWQKTEPFGKIRLSAELSGVSAEDLPADWYPEIKRMAALINDPALKARLLDIHWLGVKDPSSAREAVTNYIESARDLDHSEDWFFAAEHFHRACQLGNYLGLRNQWTIDARSALDTAIKENEEGDDNARFARLLRVVWETGTDDESGYAQMAAERGRQCHDEGDLDAARDIWNLEADFLQSLKMLEESREARIRAAMTVVEKARKLGVPGNFFGASRAMQEGITALRRATEDPKKIESIKKELLAMQPQAMKEMNGFENETDITEEVEKVRRSFDGLSLADSIKKLCFAQPLVKVADLRVSTERLASQSIAQFFDGTLHDSDGRVVHHQKGLAGLVGDEREKVLEQQMFTSLHQFYWNCRSSCFIEPARRKIIEQHRLHKVDLLELVSDNPFVPPGHEEIFLRGLHAGFLGDFLTASLFLVPQIEESIRHVLKNNGVDISNLKDDQTQPVKLLGSLFDLPETKMIFGESYWFELRGLLIEKTGSEIRNRVAHGFISNPECYSGAAKNIWWIVLRLCVSPLFAAEQEHSRKANPENDGASEG